MYEKIKKWYEWGLWSKKKVHDVVPELISTEEYEQITGEAYVPDPDKEATTEDYQNALEELGVINEEEQA